MSQRKVIWFGITASTFVYGAVVYSLAQNWPRPGDFDAAVQRPTTLALYAVAVVTFALAFIVPTYIKHHQPRFIAAMALFEACAVLGLMATFLAQDWRVFIAPWLLALMGFARRYPSE